jgi:hypothetical protein
MPDRSGGRTNGGRFPSKYEAIAVATGWNLHMMHYDLSFKIYENAKDQNPKTLIRKE